MAFTPKTDWASGYIIESADINRWEAGIEDADNRATALEGRATALETPATTVTSLPTTGLKDGMIVDYLADAAAGIVWRLKYRSGSASTYKWEFVGGAPLSIFKAGTQGATAIDPGSPGLDDPTCLLTPPLSGDYTTEWGATIYTATGAGGGILRVRQGTTIMNGQAFSYANGANPLYMPGYCSIANTLVGGTALRLNFYTSGASDINLQDRFMKLTPIRVG